MMQGSDFRQLNNSLLNFRNPFDASPRNSSVPAFLPCPFDQESNSIVGLAPKNRRFYVNAHPSATIPAGNLSQPYSILNIRPSYSRYGTFAQTPIGTFDYPLPAPHIIIPHAKITFLPPFHLSYRTSHTFSIGNPASPPIYLSRIPVCPKTMSFLLGAAIYSQ